jgi:serine/threonine protein kinase
MKKSKKDLKIQLPGNCTTAYANRSYRVKDNAFEHSDGITVSDLGIEVKHPNQGAFEDEELMNSGFVNSLKELKVGSALGRGQSGFVRLATHTHPQTGAQTMVVLKSMDIYDKGNRHQIVKELKALYSLDHKNVITFYNAFFDAQDSRVVAVLEYMDCGALSDVREKVTKIPEPILGVIAYQLLQGFDYMHSKKRVHRDVKPQNICLNSKGEAKLTDFGLTKEIQNSLGNCKTMLGTYSYMSPERIKNEGYRYKSDIWSLGIVLMECAGGVFPYGECGGLHMDLITRIADDDSPTLKNAQEFSPEFIDFLAKSLEKDPKKRATAEKLMRHPWIQNCREQKINLAKWLKKQNCILQTS